MHKHFQVGDIIRLNPDAPRFSGLARDLGLGPFEVVKRYMTDAGGWQQMDVRDVTTGKVHISWGAEIEFQPVPEILLDTFMDAVRKAHAKSRS